MSAPPQMPPVPLGSVPTGRRVQIFALLLASEVAARLRELGVREGATARVVHRAGGQVVLGVDEGRIAVATEAASRVLVREEP